jgi:hypothetical protein
LRLDQRNQFFPRRLRLRIAIHESLNRNAIPLSRKIYQRELTAAAELPGLLPEIQEYTRQSSVIMDCHPLGQEASYAFG